MSAVDNLTVADLRVVASWLHIYRDTLPTAAQKTYAFTWLVAVYGRIATIEAQEYARILDMYAAKVSP